MEVAQLTAILAGATEVSSFGSVSTLLSESLHLKITNKRVLSSHRVIVAELHETGCSTGCFLFCFVSGRPRSFSSHLCVSDCSAT